MERNINGLTSCLKTGARINIAIMVFFVLAVLLPGVATASVVALTQWPSTPTIVSNGSSGTVSGSFVTSSGNNRVMLVAVATEYTAAATPVLTVTYGGQAVTPIAANATANINNIWIGYLKETGIAAATGTTLSVSNALTTNLTAMYATVALYKGVDQAATPTGSAASTTGALSLSTTYNVSGLPGNNGLSLYVTNWNGLASIAGGTPVHFEIRDYAGINFNLASGYAVVTTGTSAPSSSVVASSAGAIAGVGLAPAVRVAANSSCSDCHAYPPNDASSSRNAPPGEFIGAHNKHAGLQEQQNQYGFACTVCHKPVAGGLSHQTGFKNITGSRLPGNAYSAGKRIAMTNNPANGTCSNTACHSTGRITAQFATTPTWSSSGITCLNCHAGRSSAAGAPSRSTAGFTLSTTHSQHLKYSSTQINCQNCHGKTATDAATLKQYTGVKMHVNGTADVAFTGLVYGSYTSYKTSSKTCNNISCHGGKTRSGWSSSAINTNNTCVHCHGVAGTAASVTNAGDNRKFFAPGWGGTGTSTDQVTANTDIRVGAHFKHLSSIYMAKLKCNECHKVPSNVFDAGHIDAPRYNSQTLSFGQASSASRNLTTPAFIAGTASAAATCSTTYCHGSKLPGGDTSGTDKSPVWNSSLTTGTPGTAECARCHGNPPSTGTSATFHTGKTPTTSCSGCHNMVVDGTGKIINKALHINGGVNASGACNLCHGYDSTDTWSSSYGVEGIGAHVKHISYLKTRYGITLAPATDSFGGANFQKVCGVCHTWDPAQHQTGSRTINFNNMTTFKFGSSAPQYYGASGSSSSVNPKSCANIVCHYTTSPIWSTY